MAEKVKRELTREDAERVLAEERQKRLMACQAEIERVLNEHNARLVAIPSIAPDGRVVATVQLMVD